MLKSYTGRVILIRQWWKKKLTFFLELALNSHDELDAKTAQVCAATRYTCILDTVG